MKLIFALFVMALAGLHPIGTMGNANASEPSMEVGVAVHLWWRDKDDIDAFIEAAARGKFKIIRWDAPWKAVEVIEDRLSIPPLWDYIVDRARDKGIESLLILDYGNKFYDNADKPISDEAVKGFRRYSEFVVEHFKTRVRYYQIWNEWNGRVGQTTPGKSKDYARLIRAVSPAIKAVDSHAFVIVGAISSGGTDSVLGHNRGFDFDELLREDIGKFCDAFAIHPYVVYKGEDDRSYASFERLTRGLVERIRATRDLEAKPIFVTEIGWSAASGHPKGVTEDEQARYLSGALRLFRTLGISSVIVYRLKDGIVDPTNPEENFGLFRADWTPRKALAAIMEFIAEQPKVNAP